MTVNGPPSLPRTVMLPARAGRPGVAPIVSRLAFTWAAVGEAAGFCVGDVNGIKVSGNRAPPSSVVATVAAAGGFTVKAVVMSWFASAPVNLTVNGPPALAVVTLTLPLSAVMEFKAF